MKKAFFLVVVVALSTNLYSQNQLPANGSVGIGTLNPQAPLHVNGNQLLNGNLIIGTDQTAFFIKGPANGGAIRIRSNSSSSNDRDLQLGNMDNNYSWNSVMTVSQNGFVGVGTTNPVGTFHVRGNTFIGNRDFAIGTSGSFIQIDQGAAEGNTYSQIRAFSNGGNITNNLVLQNSGGNVGIGIITPRERLDIGGNAIIQNTLQTNDYTNVGQHQGQLRILNGLGTYGSKAFEIALMDNGTSVLQSNEAGIGYNNIALNPVSGDVGIGTMDPKGYKLAVNGNIRAREIKVETANWPDYVFAKDYHLPTLEQTKQHIREKGHLPGIPSAEDVNANGVDLGDMNAKLLKKIEEMTLYLIELSDTVKNQQTEINNLKKR